MGVFRNVSPDLAVQRATAAWDVGVTNVEIPVQTKDALPTLDAVISAATERGLHVGAGTITTIEQLETVVAAGATYTVSPGFDPEIAAASLQAGLPHLPGVATASEILAARRIGLDWLKAFPGSLLGARWITAMLGPFPDARFAVTGGMTAHTARDFLDAGAHVVAVSNAFDDAAELERIREFMRNLSLIHPRPGSRTTRAKP